MIDSFDGEYRFLSNFHFARVEYEGVYYRSVEHAYQAAKCADPDHRKTFERMHSPAMAKRAGRKVELRSDWEDVKERVMLDLLRQKFDYNDLRDALLATGDEELVEGNWWGDTYWGVCRGVGENRLGRLLMQVREEIR